MSCSFIQLNRNSHYIPLVEISDFNVLKNNKSFFDQSIKKSIRLWKT